MCDLELGLSAGKSWAEQNGWRKGTSVRGRGAREEWTQDLLPLIPTVNKGSGVGWCGAESQGGTDAETQEPAHSQAGVSRKRPGGSQSTTPKA